MAKKNHAIILRNKERRSLRFVPEYPKYLQPKADIWKEVPGYYNRFQVCNTGEVCMVKLNFNRVLLPQNQINKRDKESYLIVHFKMGDRIVKRLVHELVANAFIPNPLKLTNIRHKNENFLDNRACNLEWV
jgi:hypothetical protein